jgi:hypothetical protein
LRRRRGCIALFAPTGRSKVRRWRPGRRRGMSCCPVPKLHGRGREPLRSRRPGAGSTPRQAAAVKSRGRARWRQSAKDIPWAGRDQRDDRPGTAVDASYSRAVSSTPGAVRSPGTSLAGTWVLGWRRPACRRRASALGARAALREPGARRAREQPQGPPPRGQRTEAAHWGGPTRRSNAGW